MFMNGKKSKAIRKQMKPLFLNWLSDLLPEEETKKLTEKNFSSYLPKETHLFIDGSIKLHAFSPRWLVKQIKRFHKQNPTINIDCITLEDLKKVYERRQ